MEVWYRSVFRIINSSCENTTMTTIGPFTKMDFRTITSRCTTKDREFVRELLESKTSAALIIAIDNSDGAVTNMVIPTDVMLSATYARLITEVKASDRIAEKERGAAHTLREYFSDGFRPEITDSVEFVTAFMTALKAMKENRSFSPLGGLGALVGMDLDRDRFKQFLADGRSPKENSVPCADYGMAWGFFSYFESLVQYTPKAVYLQVQVKDASKGKLIIKKLGYYSLVDPDKAAREVGDALARVFNLS